MKKLLILFLFIGIANAGIFDVFKIKDAQEAFKKSDYNATIQDYSKVKNPSDKVRYNLGEAYYKAKKYKQALSEFKAIKSKKLEFKKLHNMGNTLAHLKKIDDAIKAYEKALKIKEDKDTRYNLELLKKMKKKQQQKKKNQKKKQNKKNKNKKNNKQNKKNQNKNGGKGQNKKNKQNKSSKQNQKNQQNKQKQNSKKEQENKNKQNSQQNQNKQEQQNKKQNRKDGKGKDKKDKQKEKEKLSEVQKKKQEQAKKQKMGKNGKPKKLPISDMELRKYNKQLDKRGIKTLLLPINTKGAKQDEKNINPW